MKEAKFGPLDIALRRTVCMEAHQREAARHHKIEADALR